MQSGERIRTVTRTEWSDDLNKVGRVTREASGRRDKTLHLDPLEKFLVIPSYARRLHWMGSEPCPKLGFVRSTLLILQPVSSDTQLDLSPVGQSRTIEQELGEYPSLPVFKAAQ